MPHGVPDRQSFRTVTDERALYEGLGKGHLYDHEMAEAKKNAKFWRDVTKGSRHPEGMGALGMSIPQTIVDAARKANEHIYIYSNDRPAFWCQMWHRYPDFRCVNFKGCPWCGKKDRAFSFSVSPSLSNS